jgi:hypothetical protein
MIILKKSYYSFERSDDLKKIKNEIILNNDLLFISSIG